MSDPTRGDLAHIFAADSLDPAVIEALVEFAERDPDAFEELASQALHDLDSEDGGRALPTPLDPDEQRERVQAQRDHRGLGGTEIGEPASFEALVNLVVDAGANQRTLRAVGAFRSLSDVAEPSGDEARIVLLSRLRDIRIDSASRQATVWAGANVGRVNAVLHANGLALPNMGTGDFQTLVGAISTGTHGAGTSLGDLASAVIGVELLTLDGTGAPVLYRLSRSGVDVHADRTDPGAVRVVEASGDAFLAAVISLGCLGVVVSMTLQCVEPFCLREDRAKVPWDEVRDGWATAPREVRHYEVLYDVYGGEALVTTRRVVDAANSRGRPVSMRLAASPVGRGVAHMRLKGLIRNPDRLPNTLRQAVGCTQVSNYARQSFEVLKIGLDIDATGLEVAIPYALAPQAAEYIGRFARERLAALILSEDWVAHAAPTSPISLRPVAASDGLLSMQHGGDRVMIEIPMLLDHSRDPSTDAEYAAYLEGVHAMYRQLEAELAVAFDARPHWGQYFAADAARIGTLWPDSWERWVAQYQQLNVSGVFVSRFSERVGL